MTTKMKRHFSAIAFLLLPLLGMQARGEQDSTSTVKMLEGDKIWSYTSYNKKKLEYRIRDVYAYMGFRLYGEKHVNGRSYREMGYSLTLIGSRSNEPIQTPYVGIREESGRIYVDKEEYLFHMSKESELYRYADPTYLPYEETADGELVLYDFTMKPGDSFRHVDGHDDIVVDSVGTLTTLDGVERRLIYLSNGCQVAEGLGCLNSTGTLLSYLNPKNMEGMEFYTEYCALTNLIKDGETCFERTLEEIVDGMAKVPVNTKSLLSYFPFIHYYITSQDLLTTGEWPHSAYEDEYIVETSWRTAEDSLREQGYRYITFRRESSISSGSSSKSSTIIAREDGGRVYVKIDDYMALLANDSYWSQVGDASYIPSTETENGELMLYDFTMKPGDSFRHVDGHDDIVVDSVGTLTTLDGVERRLIYLSNGCQVAEGLGCLNSIGALFFYLNPLRSDYQRGFLSTFAPTYSSMVGYYNKYIYYYTLQEERETILAGIESVARAECSTSESLLFFDLQGRHLSQKPEQGLYIQNGRKVVIK